MATMETTESEWTEEDVVTETDLTNLPHAGARVVVADDDNAMRRMVASDLTHDGYEVHEAESGDDLLRILNSISVDAWPSDRVDLLVMDIRMPGVSGLQVARKLLAERWSTPVILMTAFPDSDVREEAHRMGVPLLAKPFTLASLRRVAMDVLLARGGILDEKLGSSVKAKS